MKQIVFFALPLMLGNLFQMLYNTADTIVVGNFVGKEALAAVGATSMITNLAVFFFSGFSTGASVAIAQAFGAKDREKVHRAVETAFAMTLIIAAVFTAAGIPLAKPVLRLMGTPEDVFPDAAKYLQIYFAGIAGLLIYNIGSGILRAVGDSRRPLYFLIAACMTNIVLDLFLVMGLDMGVAGAAWATILSQTVSAILVIVVLVRSPMAYHLDVRKIRFHGDLLARIVRIGLPAGLQSVMYSISNVIIQTFVNGFGTDVSAAWSAWGRMDGLYWMILNAFGISITTFVGQNFGAMKFDRVKQGVRQCLLMALAAAALCTALMLLFGEQIYHLFANEEEVIARGMEILRLISPFFVTYVFVEILSGALRGAGESLMPTLFTFFGVCVLRLVWLLGFVSRNPSVPLTMVSYPVTWIVASTLFIVYYLKGGWMKRCQERLVTKAQG
jgi:putative MATE family efflux protein